MTAKPRDISDLLQKRRQRLRLDLDVADIFDRFRARVARPVHDDHLTVRRQCSQGRRPVFSPGRRAGDYDDLPGRGLAARGGDGRELPTQAAPGVETNAADDGVGIVVGRRHVLGATAHSR